jgi:phosphate starvation-inducible PhoH-like protein
LSIAKKTEQKNANDHWKKKLEYQLKKVVLKPSQQDHSTKIINSDIVICKGPAGTSKTFTTCYSSLKLLHDGLVNQIVMVKPVEESGEHLGFLPGSEMDKIAPYIRSYRSNIIKIIGNELLFFLEDEKKIIFESLAYMRGTTYDHCVCLLDEAQNADFRQLMLFITRMGKNTKVLISGDVSQYDIKTDMVALPKFEKLMQGIKGLSFHEYFNHDIVRNKILIEITERYEKWRFENYNNEKKKL